MTTRELTRRRRPGEQLLIGVLFGCAAVCVATTVGIILTLGFETMEFLRRVPLQEFLFGTRWAPTFADASFGVLPLVSATLLVTGIALVVAVPLGLASAIYLSEYARPRVRAVIKPALEIVAGVPTVVFGYFALTFLTPELLQELVPGTRVFNTLAAGLVIGIMIIPLIASIAEDAMRAVPNELRQASYGLGAVRRTTALKVIVPAAFSGIVAAVLLAASRAIGETMVVAVAAGQMAQMTADPREPSQTMTAYIVQVSLGDTPSGSTAYLTIFALGALLFTITFALNIVAVRIVGRVRERYE
ncbi:MAG: phosphate transporter permease [Thermoleophilia bacterium]|nr:phosphate transporter permease [Thermoleophilia bacterium]MCZ4496971.1 phosphate transporter permease [Thermoleophilia bacterium]